jgi:actin-like ATPase involved in cell morphogenesis
MTGVRVGIDLGTCYSSVGYNDQHGVHFIQDPTAAQLTYSIPSSALLRQDDSLVFGELAESEKNVTPEGYRREFKRDLGSKEPYRLHGRKFTAAELTGRFLDFLVVLTTTALDAAPPSAVITVPAFYDEFRKSLIEDAGRHAGLPGISVAAEPVAAVVGAVDRGEISGDVTVLVYDLGGGTFDAAVVRIDDGELTVLGDKGLGNFGGTDIDRLIEQDFMRKAGDAFTEMLSPRNPDDPKLVAQAQRIRIGAEDFCRKIKHRLSSSEHAYDVLNLTFEYELSRRELEDMVRPGMYRTVSTCQDLLTTVALAPEQIDTVLLIGGTSRMPIVREILIKELGRPVRSAADPELAVCTGAAILAQARAETNRRTRERAGRRTRETGPRRTRAQQDAELRERERQARSAGDIGDPAGARDLLAALLPARKRLSGAEDPHTLSVRHNLAYWTGRAADPAAARDQFAALLPIRERVSGPEDPETLNVRFNLAYWTGEAGDPAAARDQLAELLPVRRRVLGAGHPDVSSTSRELDRWTRTADQRARELAKLRERERRARSAGADGNPAAARDQLTELVPVREQMSGAEDRETLALRHSLAFWTGEAGDPAAARDQFTELLPVRERVSGPEDPETLNARYNRAFWTGNAGDPAAARDQLAALAPVRERILGTGDPGTWATLRELAYWTGEAGDPVAARDKLAVLLPAVRAAIGPDHRDTLATWRQLAHATGEAGDPVKARDELAALLVVIKRALGAKHRDTLATRQELERWSSDASRREQEQTGLRDREKQARAAGGSGDVTGARDQLAALLPDIEQACGAEDPYTLGVRHNLAYWTGRAADPAAARDQFAALLPVRERVSGAEDPETLNVRFNLAHWTGEAGDPAAARDLLAALLADRERILGASDPATVTTLRELGRWASRAAGSG